MSKGGTPRDTRSFTVLPNAGNSFRFTRWVNPIGFTFECLENYEASHLHMHILLIGNLAY
jgi:hypothetical protein